MVRYKIYVHERANPSYCRNSEWHLFVLGDEPPDGRSFTLCRNLTFDLASELRDKTPIPLSQWQENAGSEVLCSVCNELAREALVAPFGEVGRQGAVAS